MTDLEDTQHTDPNATASHRALVGIGPLLRTARKSKRHAQIVQAIKYAYDNWIEAYKRHGGKHHTKRYTDFVGGWGWWQGNEHATDREWIDHLASWEWEQSR